jgi:hypothetical protein
MDTSLIVYNIFKINCFEVVEKIKLNCSFTFHPIPKPELFHNSMSNYWRYKNLIMKKLIFICLMVVQFFIVMPYTTYGQLIACRAIINISLNNDGTTTLTPSLIAWGTLDPAFNYTLSRTFFTCANIGTHEVTLSQFSSTGVFINSCSSIVNIESKLLPDPCAGTTLSCLTSLTLSLGLDGTYTLFPLDVSGMPLNPAYTYTLSKSVFTCADLGPQPVTLSQFAAGGVFTNSCTSTVNVESRLLPDPCVVRPIVVCRSIVNLNLGSDGTASITPADILNLIEAGNTYTLSKSNFDCSNVGPNEITVTATNAAGNTNSCIMTINVEDKRPSPPPCISFLLESIRYIPILIFENPILVNDKINISIDITGAFQEAEKIKPISEFSLSRDQIKSNDDIVIGTTNVKFKKNESKTTVDSKIKIPKLTEYGKYYLIIDLVNKKGESVAIGFSPIVGQVEILSDKNNSNSLLLRSIGNEVELSPNPFADILKINTSTVRNVDKVCIYNIQGKLVFSTSLPASNTEDTSLDLSKLSNGIYILQLTKTNQEQHSYRIIKQ